MVVTFLILAMPLGTSGKWSAHCLLNGVTVISDSFDNVLNTMKEQLIALTVNSNDGVFDERSGLLNEDHDGAVLVQLMIDIQNI